jgi:hypothetical protein
MTFALSLFALAAASCGLDVKFDPDGDICKLSTDKWGNMDADSVPAAATHKMSLTIHEKDAHEDIFEFAHSATTPGSLSDKVNGRYILDCPQPAGTETDAAGEKVPNKAVKFTVHRPADMTEFGSEWVKLYPKDSWKNVTNEYEPWTMNKYGAKIPLNRNTPDGDPPNPDKEDSVTVYMEVSDIGDYEVKYGNPQIKTYPSDGSDPEGRWVAVEFKSTLLRVGSPWAECETDPEVLEKNSVELGTIIPAFFGHPNLNKEAYEAFITEVIAGKSTVSDTSVVFEIFGDGTMTKTKGLYTMSEAKADLPAGIEKTAHNSGKDYTSCYEAGNACPENHQVCEASYCELDTFEALIKQLQDAGVKVLGAVGAGATEEDYAVLNTKVDGFFHLIITDGGLVASLAGEDATTDSLFKVAASGMPLFESNRAKIDEADTYVTLAFDALGVWNPYSWYPHIASKKWAAIVDSVTEQEDMEKAVKTLVDRGYGYIYVTDKVVKRGTVDGPGFTVKSKYNAALFAALATAMVPPADRRLEEGRRLSDEPTYSWGCDDTLLQCSPVCLKQNGAVTTLTSESMCAGEPMDMCKCKCYYDAEWVCQDDNVVCMAKRGVAASVVGDLVCETRGTKKPSCAQTPMPTTRGSFPTEQCLTTWGTTVAPEVTTTEEPTEVTTTKEPVDDEVEEDEEQGQTTLVMESFSMAAALTLVALH